MKHFAAFAFILVALTACGSSRTPVKEGVLIGSVAGYPFYVVESAFTRTHWSLEHPATTVVMLTDHHGLCDGAQTENFGKNLAFLSISLFAIGPPATWPPPTSPVSPGTYNLNTHDPITGTAQFLKQDDRCQLAPGLTTPVSSSGGSIVLESISAEPGGNIVGSFDITMASGDRITATFDAPYCPPYSQPSFRCGNPSLQ